MFTSFLTDSFRLTATSTLDTLRLKGVLPFARATTGLKNPILIIWLCHIRCLCWFVAITNGFVDLLPQLAQCYHYNMASVLALSSYIYYLVKELNNPIKYGGSLWLCSQVIDIYQLCMCVSSSRPFATSLKRILTRSSYLFLSEDGELVSTHNSYGFKQITHTSEIT